MNAAILAKLSDFLDKGGRVLSSGTAGLNRERTWFALSAWDFQWLGLDRSNASYFHIVDADDPKLTDMDYCMYSDSGTLFTGGRVLARYVTAYFDRHWDGFHGYFYTPPEREADRNAAAVTLDGKVCHVSFEVFTSYYKSAAYANKALVRKCLDLLLPDPLIRTRGVPSTARVTATGCDEYTLVHVKVTHPELRGCVSVIEEHAVLEAGAIVRIRGRYGSACTLPAEEPVGCIPEGDGYTTIVLPRITGYAVFLLRG
jgi:hypothetical protein